MERIDPRGRTALVTGASSGLGVDFARELARRGANVILVARREDRLREVAESIGAEQGVRAVPMVQDLGAVNGAQALFDQVEADGHQIDLLVNNAGFGLFGEFLEMDWDKVNAMLQLDIVALAQLSKLFGRAMAARGFGAMLQVASIASFQPSPGYAGYGAAKSFVRTFSYAINHEMRGRGVSSTALSPGVTATEFHQVAGQRKNWFHKMTMMQPDVVARIGIDAMLARRGGVVCGWMNKFGAQIARAGPTGLSTAIAAVVMKN